MADLAGKSLIVTGGGSGIGEAMVVLAAERGALLTIADRDVAAGEAVCARVRASGATACFVRADIADAQDVASMVAAAIDTYGRIDCAFNNAGISNANIPFADMPDDVFRRMQDINLTGTFLCMKHEIGAMLKTGGGAIVNVSSTAAVSILPNMGDYGTAKAGLLGMTRAAALDHGKQGIRVNAILPGPTLTPAFIDGVKRFEGLEAYLADRQPIGRLLQPREIAMAGLVAAVGRGFLRHGHRHAGRWRAYHIMSGHRVRPCRPRSHKRIRA